MLERDALYVRVQTTHQEGIFRWALVFVDGAGRAMRYEWTVPPRPAANGRSRPPSAHLSGPQPPAEVFVHGPLVPLPAPKTLGYYKLGAYVGGMGHVVLEEIGTGVFRRSYGSVQENRLHGLSSSAWVFQVLGALQERDFIRCEGPPTEPELVRMAHDADINQLRAFMFGMPYKAVIRTV